MEGGLIPEIVYILNFMDTDRRSRDSAAQQALVCFDLGRVLVRICDGWVDAFKEAGLQFDPPPTLRRVAPILSEAVHALELGTLSLDEFAIRGASFLGIEVRHVRAVVDAFVRGPYPGAALLLDDLAQAGVWTACLSNTNHRHWQLMSSWTMPEEQLLRRLTFRFASHTIGVRKPDEMAYAIVERETGVVPSQIVFFDDLIENVEAARRRGWQAVHVAPCDDPVMKMRAHLRDSGHRF
jgi:FMN phosphatase YigB (HAD superfamily)